MSESEKERPKHTLSGDSEPSMPEPGKLHMQLLTIDGVPAMHIMIPLKDERVIYFTAVGADLETFYLRLRDFMEGKRRKPAYLA